MKCWVLSTFMFWRRKESLLPTKALNSVSFLSLKVLAKLCLSEFITLFLFYGLFFEFEYSFTFSLFVGYSASKIVSYLTCRNDLSAKMLYLLVGIFSIDSSEPTSSSFFSIIFLTFDYNITWLLL